MSEGVHIRGTMQTNPHVPLGPVLFRCDVWPLPHDIALMEELNLALKEAANKVLRARKIVGDTETDLTAKGRAN